VRFLGLARISCTPTRSGPALVISSEICCSLRAYRSLVACSALAAGRSKFSRFQVMTENMLAPSPCHRMVAAVSVASVQSQYDLLGPVNRYWANCRCDAESGVELIAGTRTNQRFRSKQPICCGNRW
jgi:hypothetical protein